MPDDHSFPLPPEPVYRCALDLWRFRRGLSVAELARAMGVRQATLFTAFLPPDDKNFRVATIRTRERAKTYTRGEIGLDDWPKKATAKAGSSSEMGEVRHV